MAVCVCVCVCVSGLIWWMCHKLLHACVHSVCFFISCVIPCKNINTTLPISNILNMTQQVLMLPLDLLCVIYLRVLLFPLFFTLTYTADVDWVCGSLLLRSALMSAKGGLVMCHVNNRSTVTPNTVFDTIYITYVLLTIKLSIELLTQIFTLLRNLHP